MRDLLNSTLPRHFLSELDEEYGIVDVSPILDALYLPAAIVLDPAQAEIKLQNKFARKHVDGHLGRREAYLEMCLEVSETNDRSAEHTSELQSLMRITSPVSCLKKKK